MTGAPGLKEPTRKQPPVEIRLGLLKVGDIAIGAVNAEVFNPIAQRLKARVALHRHDDGDADEWIGAFGYIPNDAAYGMYTFEVLSSRLKPGCAETSIVNGILDLMAEAQNTSKEKFMKLSIMPVVLMAVQVTAFAQSNSKCPDMAKFRSPGVTLEITRAEMVPAGRAPGARGGAAGPVLPAHCRIDGMMDRRTGS